MANDEAAVGADGFQPDSAPKATAAPSKNKGRGRLGTIGFSIFKFTSQVTSMFQASKAATRKKKRDKTTRQDKTTSQDY